MKLVLAVLLLYVTPRLPAQEPVPGPKADFIYLHGNIYSGMEVRASFHEIKRAQAMAVRGDRVLALGTESEVLRLKGPQTVVVDLGGHFVMPGFNDAHMHMAEAGFQRLTVNLVGVRSLAEFRERWEAAAH